VISNNSHQQQHASNEEKLSMMDLQVMSGFGNQQVDDEQTTQRTNNKNSLIQAADSLEQVLSSLELPPVFPNAGIVEQHLRDLRSLNKTNHQLFSELLTMQVCISVNL
jgi:hypothetical protein